ncbi:MAG: N-acetyl sugar amidotransferase, partial [Chloroflexi bacterium]|nr:N-acetyl sugar amidotransferase [Chloroflexota bacterium]
HHLTREEGVALVRQFDGETPQHYMREVLDYIDLDMEEFMDLCDQFRSPHLWEKVNGEWKLLHQVA